MGKNEATARLKINQMLTDSGWRLVDEDNKRANVQVESGIKLEEVGDDYEHATNGAIDYLLMDENNHPLAVLEAKRESISPLSAKEQARNYANNAHARYIILSNGNLHFLWDTHEGNPEPISKFPTPNSLQAIINYKPNLEALSEEPVDANYIARSQIPDFEQEPAWLAEGEERKNFIDKNKLKIMRNYQVDAIKAIQSSSAAGNMSYLLEMATGTGKTLTCAAIIKLFLRTENAKRVLFLVDRLELEDQAKKAFNEALGKDFITAVYKENRSDWGKAQIVVTTVQSLMANDRYMDEFSPTDFELVISDEAHRSINGNARAVFEYFIGYRIGLTATPKDYLKGVKKDEIDTLKDFERRKLLDTYKTFGCESGEPTFRYSLIDGVNDPDGPFLVNPVVIDARTDITTQMLSDEGYAVKKTIDETEVDAVFGPKDFERKFFNEKTNRVLCETFITNADYDPISKELGKGIIFAVSQAHAAKLVNVLNHLAHEKWPGKYDSDFAVQVTSDVSDAQKFTTRFTNNNLKGHTQWLNEYESSRARVCVTVGMMTTGYDCPDLQNVCFMRPVYSPSDFIQMKGRGTRKYKFTYTDYSHNEEVITQEKTQFKLIDFFAVCEYFNEQYDYKTQLKPPKKVEGSGKGGYDINSGDSGEDEVNEPASKYRPVELGEIDALHATTETSIGKEGMHIDREMFAKFQEEASNDEELVKRDEYDRSSAIDYLKHKVFNQPEHYMTLNKMRKAFKLDRGLSVDEALDIIMGRIEEPKYKQDIMEEKFKEAISVNRLSEKLAEDSNLYRSAHNVFDSYISSKEVQDAIDSGQYGRLHQTGELDFEDFATLKQNELADPLIQYIHDYVEVEKLRN